MSLRALQRLARNIPDNGNSTSSPNMTHLPDTILEAFIPGYSLLSSLMLSVFGFDASFLLSLTAVAAGLVTGGQYVFKRLKALFLQFFTCTIHIESEDEFYYYLTTWITKVEALKNLRAIQIQSVSGHEGFYDEVKTMKELTEEELFNYSNWESKIPPTYMPAMGAHWFWYKRNLFKFERRRDTVTRDSWVGEVLGSEKSINLTVLGRSPEPGKRLLLDARDMSLAQESSKTIVRRPSPKETRGRGRQAWMRVAMRPSRPMETVVLDSVQKGNVLRDINEFVHPETPHWYANRGIPYRRGYLFYGPPGTGKTSLSFAIAGVFGLDIYCISLLEPTLTEEDLSILFNNLPARCVVLLEDIDSAGLHRVDKSKDEESGKGRGSKKGGKGDKEEESSSSVIAKEMAKAFKDVSEQAAKNNPRGLGNNQGISLSGLLNAIDGVASPEGRVLVMTTNYPEKLDEALIRPGRVDLKVEFTLATRLQIRELFLRMYTSDKAITSRPKPEKVSDIVAPAVYETEATTVPNGSTSSADAKDKGHVPTLVTLSELADNFASQLPEYTFSPAEIQGFLLTRKKDPKRAVDEVEKWKQDVLESRKKNEEAEKAGDEEEAPDKDTEKENAKSNADALGVEAVKAEANAGNEAKFVNGTGTNDHEHSAGDAHGDGKRDRRETVTQAEVNGETLKKAAAEEHDSERVDGDPATGEAIVNGDSKKDVKDDKDEDEETPEPYPLKESLFDEDDASSTSPSRTNSDLSENSITSLGSNE